MSYTALSVARSRRGWTGRELDLSGIDDVDELGDLLRDESDDGGTVLMLLEEDDEYVAVVRVEPDGEPVVFLSDRRAAAGSAIARVLAEADVDLPDPDDETTRPAAEPTGDPGLLADLGTPGDRLLSLCAEEGLLPGDVIAAVAEDCGFLDVVEEVRGA